MQHLVRPLAALLAKCKRTSGGVCRTTPRNQIFIFVCFERPQNVHHFDTGREEWRQDGRRRQSRKTLSLVHGQLGQRG